MKNKLIYPMVVVVLAAACGGSEGRGVGAGKQYETVQEGSASGVTSTIAGPGETLPPITGTNADTTSAFTLNPNVAPQPVAGTGAIPAAPPYADAAVAPMTPVSGSSPAAPRTTADNSQPVRQPVQPRTAAVAQPMTSASRPFEQEAPRAEQTQPREAQPAEGTATASTTDTVAAPAQSSEPQPAADAPKQQPKEQPQAQPQQEPADDAAAEEPPPPPPAF